MSENFVYLVLPSLKIGGGVLNALRYAHNLSKSNLFCSLILWRSNKEYRANTCEYNYLSKFSPNIKYSLFHYPIILSIFLFKCLIKSYDVRNSKWIFTHYSTYPLSLLIPKKNVIYYIQGVEHKFVSNSFLSFIYSKLFILFYKHGSVVVTSNYIYSELSKLGVNVNQLDYIKVSKDFYNISHNERDIDFVMVVRSASIKRLDMYCDLINLARERSLNFNFLVITPEMSVANAIRALKVPVLFDPSAALMKDAYSRSKFFLLLSDHEGFGLPPLEAMGSGCFPICRDCGGINAYMINELSQFVLPAHFKINDILEFCEYNYINYNENYFASLAFHNFKLNC